MLVILISYHQKEKMKIMHFRQKGLRSRPQYQWIILDCHQMSHLMVTYRAAPAQVHWALAVLAAVQSAVPWMVANDQYQCTIIHTWTHTTWVGQTHPMTSVISTLSWLPVLMALALTKVYNLATRHSTIIINLHVLYSQYFVLSCSQLHTPSILLLLFIITSYRWQA